MQTPQVKHCDAGIRVAIARSDDLPGGRVAALLAHGLGARAGVLHPLQVHADDLAEKFLFPAK